MLNKREIIVVAGREYQVRIRKEVSETDYVHELLGQAKKITNSICDSMGCSIIEDDDYSMAMAPNNVVMFTSVRGAGKTSIMRTFAEQLRKDTREQKTKYCVLETLIEPALFAQNESIVRFVLSRLYAEFIELIEGRDIDWSGLEQRKFSANICQVTRNDVAELKQQFRKCLQNIENINAPKTQTLEMDELDSLANIGFSANLRKNIEDLINKYIQLLGKLGYDYKYLVIQIDDADLAMGSTYQICEGIKNYLNVNNLIILMAADYKQMEYAVYQEYVKRYEKIISLTVNDADKGFLINQCHEMAAKYMEKAFPEGHRIVLPSLTEMTLKLNDERTVIKYIDSINGKKVDLFEKYKDCKSAQSQILHFIYSRTGIVFDDTIENRHPFLPKTFRELTQLLRLLRDMPEVQTIIAYQIAPGRSEGEKNYKLIGKEDRQNIARNISKLEEYFSDYWCPSNLSDFEERFVQKVLSISERNNLHDIDEIINELLINNNTYNKNDDQVFEISHSFRDCLDRIEEYCKKEKKHSALHEAMKLYYTLHLNKWIAEGWDNEKEIRKIANYIGTAFPFENNESPKDISIVNNLFEFKMENNIDKLFKVDEVLKNSDSNGLLDSVLFDKESSVFFDNDSFDKNMIDNVVLSKIKDEKTTKSVKFLNALMVLFRHPQEILKDTNDFYEETLPNNPDDTSKMVIEDDHQNRNKLMVLPYSCHTIREILTCYDLQVSLMKKYKNRISFWRNNYINIIKQESKESESLFFMIFQDILDSLDDKCKEILSHRDLFKDDPNAEIYIKKNATTPFYDSFYKESNRLSYAVVWLGNSTNCDNCVEEEKRLLTEHISFIIKQLANKENLSGIQQTISVPMSFLKLSDNYIKMLYSPIDEKFTKINDYYIELEKKTKRYNDLLSLIDKKETSNGKKENDILKEETTLISELLKEYQELLSKIDKFI